MLKRLKNIFFKKLIFPIHIEISLHLSITTMQTPL